MKYYAVKKGKQTGIFEIWEECQESISGYKGAEYKSFKSKEAAERYISEVDDELVNEEIAIRSVDSLTDDEMIIYTDGSYDNELKLASYGIVYLQKKTKDIYSSGIVDDKNGTQNVIGEITGVLEAISYAKKLNKSKVYIYHDYEGLSKWFNGEWSPTSADSVYYVNEIKKYGESIEIEFVKVKSHSGEKYNEICDKLARNELKSLEPSKSDDWGFRSFKFSDEMIEKILNKIKTDEPNFQYTVNDKGNHNVYHCFLVKDKLTFQKYKFDSSNQLLIPMNQSKTLYSLLITYLNDYNSVSSMIRSLNVNNNTEISEDTIKNRLYSLAPCLRSQNINVSIYKLILQAVYNLYLGLNDFKDCGFITTPILRALEGHLKQIFKDKLNIEITSNGFHYFDKDQGTGIYSLQQKYVNQIDANATNYINKCYNNYSIIRHKLLHFGDLDIDDTKVLNKEESQKIIINTIRLIEEYYN